jgi:hypothetical protein
MKNKLVQAVSWGVNDVLQPWFEPKWCRPKIIFLTAVVLPPLDIFENVKVVAITAASKKAKMSFAYLGSDISIYVYPNRISRHSIAQDDIHFIFQRYHIQLHFQ